MQIHAQLHYNRDESKQKQLEEVTVLLVFLMLAIIQIFLISLIVVLLKKLKYITKAIAKKYYLVVVFYIFSKFGLCLYLQVRILKSIIQKTTNKINLYPKTVEKVFDNSIVLADCSMIQLFLIAFEQYISLSFSVFANKMTQDLIRVVLQGIQLVAFLTLVIPLILYNIHVIGYELLNIFTMSLNCLSVIVFIVTFFFMNFKMTGIMMDETLSRVIKRVYKLLLGLLASRLISSIMQVIILIKIMDNTFSNFISIIEKNQNVYVVLGLCFILFLIAMILTECLPLILSLRDNAIIAMVKAKKILKPSPSLFTQPDSMIIVSSSKIQEPILSSIDVVEQQMPAKDKKTQSTLDTYYGLSRIQKADELVPENKLPLVNQHYNAYKAKWTGNNKWYFVREFGKITNYIVQELYEEIEKYNINHCKVVNHMKILEKSDKNSILVIEKFLPESLQIKMENIVKNNGSMSEQIGLALKIVKGIKQFHENLKIGHGVLHPKNILFDNSDNVYLTGFGMESLKKYLSLTDEYCNISIYTAVELLGSARQKTIIKPQKSSDIYSFGMLLYQLVSKNFNYRNLSLIQIRDKFQKENTRPKIEETMNEEVKKIVRKCWAENPAKRPEINWIISSLENLYESLQNNR